jgi:hypothetical protein
MFKGISIFEFTQKFTTDEDCYKYLEVLKWKNGYSCSKCGHTHYVKGKKESNRRCQNCQFDESVTSGTLFHKIKFPLLKAFHICYRVCMKKKGMSSLELSRELALRQKTCWLFKRKVQEAMKSSEEQPLAGRVDVDEFVIGQAEEGQPGRSNGQKRKVIIAVEQVKDGIGRAYAKVIEDFSAASFKPFFEKHIDTKAKVRTDMWRGYLPLTATYPLLEQELSGNGSNFEELHIMIMNLKSWIRGIHHHCSSEHLQSYLDEFFYRFNRRSFPQTMLHKLLDRMVKHKPLFLYGKEN